MLTYISRRLLFTIPTLFLISVVSFIIIQLPPGDFLTSIIARMEAQGQSLDGPQIAALRNRYSLDDPIYMQYWSWISGIVFRLDFGQSFEYQRPVSDLLADTLPLTILLSTCTILFVWLVSVPIGIYAAVRQYSLGDYVATTLGFLGLAVPNFLIALLVLWVMFKYLGWSVGGLNPAMFITAVIVIGTAGTAGLIRILRANLLDELRKPYAVAARARGVPGRQLLVKYPLRVAINPLFSTIGWVLPSLISADVIVSTVLSLPTTGPLLLNALMSQDMYLAGSVIMLGAGLTVIGTLISDLALAWLDPRVRLRYK